jgi:hypothetical protein
VATPEQFALYQEYVKPRTDGGPPVSVEDHLSSLRTAARLNMNDRQVAEALSVAIDYVRALKATMAKK